MNADLLVELLLDEMNVINPGDIDHQINKLAARIMDVRAQKWFTRVPRYFLFNIDQLAKEPFIVKAKPRTNAGTSKYNFHPEKGWEPGQEPNDIPASEWKEKPYAGEPGACSACNGTGLTKPMMSFDAKRDIEPILHSRKKYMMAANPEHDSEHIKQTYTTCDKCGGSGENYTPEFEQLQKELDQQELNQKSNPDEIETLVGKIKGLRQKRPELREESLEEGYDPEKQTFTTNDPFAEQDIKQSFSKFDPKSAKEKSRYGEPPAAGELPAWMINPEAENKEFHYFDPIQVRRRDLFSRLDNVVNYLNYQAILIRRGSKPEADDEAKAKGEKAEKLMQRLNTMKTEDAHGFREVVRSALNFTEDAKTKPWLFTGDAKKVAAHGSFTVRKVIYYKTSREMTLRPVNTNDWPVDGLRKAPEFNPEYPVYYPKWCTDTELQFSRYYNYDTTATPVTGSALYFIDKNNAPYALAHFPSHQLRNPYNTQIGTEDINLLVPLFIDERKFPLNELEALYPAMAAKVQQLRTIQRA